MTGLIWFVQIVHYPLTGSVGADALATYQAQHMRRTSWVVGPPMLVEASTSAWLLLQRPHGVPAWIPWVGMGLLAVVWMSTALLQVPAHNRLLSGPAAEAVPRLVATNWIRTIGWTVRAGLALWMLVLVARAMS